MRLRTAAVAVLLWSTSVSAQSFFFAWDYDRSRAPEAFLLTAEGHGGRVTWRTAPSASGACPGQATASTYCTRVPQCPALGATTFSVVAIVQGQPCPPLATPLTCQVTSQTPCVVQCDNPPGVNLAGPAPVAQVPTPDPPAEAFETADGGVILDIQEPPTQEPQALPVLQEAPPLPVFQPQASRAPV